jgi:hypothetical protein
VTATRCECLELLVILHWQRLAVDHPAACNLIPILWQQRAHEPLAEALAHTVPSDLSAICTCLLCVRGFHALRRLRFLKLRPESLSVEVVIEKWTVIPAVVEPEFHNQPRRGGLDAP